jgi:hypothetical protein
LTHVRFQISGRRGRVAAQRLGHPVAVHPRQADVASDHLGALLLGRPDPVGAGVGHAHLGAEEAQEHAQAAGRVVVEKGRMTTVGLDRVVALHNE